MQAHSHAIQLPDEAQRGPQLVAEIACSPLRVLIGQGPDLDR